MGNNAEPEKKVVKQSELETYAMIVKEKLIQMKGKAQADITKKKAEIKQFFKQNNLEGGKLKMETIMREEDNIAAYETLSFYAETLKEKVGYILFNERCPDDIRATLDTLIYASSRVNLKEFQTLRELIAIKYGDQYISEANANVMGLVNGTIIQKLTIKPVSEAAVMARLKMLNEDEKFCYEFVDSFDTVKLPDNDNKQNSGSNFNANSYIKEPNNNKQEFISEFSNNFNQGNKFNQGQFKQEGFNQGNYNQGQNNNAEVKQEFSFGQSNANQFQGGFNQDISTTGKGNDYPSFSNSEVYTGNKGVANQGNTDGFNADEFLPDIKKK